MPNKFLVETALDIGIENLKSRNTDPKKLYDEVKAAIGSEPSSEIKALYQRYIDLYEKSVAVAGQQSGKLSEEIKWKNISDLRKAVESGLSGLSPADIEGLNQFALVEYNRQNSSNRDFPDATVLDTLNRWFRLYESRKVQQNTITPAVAPTQTPTTPNTPAQAPAAARPTVYPQTDNTIIPAPEHPIAGPTRRIDGRPEPRRYVPDTTTQSHPRNRAAQTDPRRVDVAPVQPEPRIETLSEGMKRLEAAMDNFDKTIRAVSDKSGYVFDTPEEIKKYTESVNAALKPVMSALRSVEGHKLSKGEKAIYDKHIMQISKYFSNDIDGVKNRHYKNYDLAFDLAFGIIKDDLKKQKFEFQSRPTQNDVLASLKTHDPKLHEKILSNLRAGYELGQILSNPQIRSQFDKIYETVYGKWEDDMQALLKRLKDNRPTMSSPEGQVALDQMIAIMGTTEWYEWKARNEDIAGQTAGMVASTIGGVAGFALAPFSGGVTGVAGSALIGGAIATAGMIATKGRAGNDKETWTELGINTLMFGAGGAVAKWANVYMQSGKALARTTGIAVDAATGVGLGMGADYARAWSLDTKIELTSTFRNNLAWALLPIGLGMKGALRVRAEKIQGDMGRAQALATMGDTASAQAIIKKNVEPEATTLAADVQKVAPKEGTSIIGAHLSSAEKKLGDMQPGATYAIETQTGVGILAKRPDGKYEIMLEGKPTEGKVFTTPKEVETHMTQNNMKFKDTPEAPAAQAQVGPKPVQQVTETLTHSEIKVLDDIVDKSYKNLPDGKEGINIGGYKVIKLEGNKVRVTGNEGKVDFVDTKANALIRLKTEIHASVAESKKIINDGVKSAVAHFPKGKSDTLSHNGEAYSVSKGKNSEDLIMTDSKGNVVTGELQDAVWASNAQRIIKTKVDKTIEHHGHEHAFERIGPDTFVFKDWGEWSKKMNWYNWPIKIPSWMVHKVAKVTVSEFLQPLKTGYAFKDALTTKDSILGMGNNFAKAIVLRDIHPDWFSKQTAMAIGGRALTLSTLAPFGYAVMNKDDNGNSQTTSNLDDWYKIMGEFYYGGIIWGTIASHFTTDSQPLTWDWNASTPGAQVPAQSPSSSPSTIPPTVTPPPSAEVERDGAEEQIPA